MDTEDKILDFILKITLLCCVTAIIIFVALIIMQFSKYKYEPTDVNRDGITDIRDLLIVQKEIVEGK